MAIAVSVEIAAPRADVWSYAIDFAHHDAWMADAESIEFLSAERRGVGTTMAVTTKVGPLRTVDVIEVVGMVELESISVAHKGRFTGEGAFRLNPIGPHKTLMVWEERVVFPWNFGGRIGATLARPILTAIWRANLRRLRLLIEADGR